MTKIFPTEAMYKLGNGNMQACTYDLSLIPAKIYDPFYNTLPNMIYKKVENICFTCAYDRKYKASENKDKKKKEIIDNSIMAQKKNYVRHLIKILTAILPKSKLLKSLHMSNMDISFEHQKLLFESISRCTTLESFSFKNIEVSDYNFQILLNRISPYQFQELSFNGCSITNESFNSIIEFIKMQPPIEGQKIKLKSFDLSNCNLSDENIEYINNLIASLNGEIDAVSFIEPQREFNIDSSTFVPDEEEDDPTIDADTLSSDVQYKLPQAYSVAQSIRSLTINDRLKISKIDDFDSSDSSSQELVVVKKVKAKNESPSNFDFKYARKHYK